MHKFNITPDMGHYVINEQNKTVVFIINKTQSLFIDFIQDNNFNKFSLNDDFIKKFYMPNHFFGVARCSDNDKWDVEVGKAIAFSRAKDKLNKSFFKRCSNYVKMADQWIDNIVEIINIVGDKLTFNTAKRHDYIEELLNGDTKN